MKKAIYRVRHAAAIVLAFSMYIASGNAQQEQQEPPATKQNARESTANETPTTPVAATVASRSAEAAALTYAYEFTQPDFYISHIAIEHNESGQGKITFTRKNDTGPLTEPLQLSPVALARILDDWQALDNLASQDSYQAAKQFPHLGTTRLRVKNGAQPERATEFNWTNNKQAAALVDEYRRAGDQALFIFDITLARENQPLEAPKIMDRLETLISRNGVSDSQQLMPLLRDLTTDERIPLIARNHADRLLKKIGKKSKNN